MYQAATGPELIPIEIDLERVKKSREEGVLRLGQPLKSFRDKQVVFDIYEKGRVFPELNKLGTLLKPIRMKQIEDTLMSTAPADLASDPSKDVNNQNIL